MAKAEFVILHSIHPHFVFAPRFSAVRRDLIKEIDGSGFSR
jgi:hypothetical protein